MGIEQVTLYEQNETKKIKRVFYTGTDAVVMGKGLCYDRDYATAATGETATDAWGKRGQVVAAPATTNNGSFAGVAVRSYDANANGQWIEIAVPGSIVQVYTNQNCTIGDKAFITCLVGANAGIFGAAGFMGKGTARVLQTVNRSSTHGLVLAELMDGPESDLVQEIATATLTAGGALTLQVGGQIRYIGPATPATDCTATIASGTYVGQKQRHLLSGALTTNDVALAIVAEGLDGTTDTAQLELDGDGDDTLVMWGGTKWQVMANAGTALS